MSILKKTQLRQGQSPEAKKNVSGRDALGTPADFADFPPQGEQISKISNPPSDSCSDTNEQISKISGPRTGICSDTKTLDASEVARAHLKRVVYELVKDAAHYYRDDLEDLCRMSHEDLTTLVLCYFARRNAYNLGVIHEPKPHEPVRLTSEDA